MGYFSPGGSLIALFRVTALAVAIVASLSQYAQAANMLPLSSVAHEYGFYYTTESTEVAAQLSRPGLSILVRAGDPRYQVNDDVQYLSRTPVFHNNEIYVDAAFESVLARLANTHPWPDAANAPPIVTVADPPAGSPLTISTHYIDSTSTILASGNGPAGAPILLVVKARLSRDIPAITVARTTVYAAADGSYRAVISVLQLTFPNTSLQFTATAGPNVAPASATIELGPPNPKLNNPNDTVPSD
jgi:hypothetical protein